MSWHNTGRVVDSDYLNLIELVGFECIMLASRLIDLPKRGIWQHRQGGFGSDDG